MGKRSLYRASDRSRKQVKFCGIFRDKIAEKSADFTGIFGANLAGKQSVKNSGFCGCSGQISQEIDWFCANQTNIFNVFLTEVIIAISTTICYRNEPMARPLTSWLVSSFLQHNLCLVVSEHCLHVSMTKFWHKFASLQQVNTPSSLGKFQNCCTDMYLIRFLPNFAVFCVFLWISRDFADLQSTWISPLRDRTKYQKPCL